MKKIMLVFGTRPEAIKMAPLINAFRKYSDIVDVKVCVTGQHREMLDQVLSLFHIFPDIDLHIMKPNQDLYDVTTAILSGMRDVLSREKVDLVFVHGDTSTSMAAALAAFYQQIPVAHVEAGLRTNDIYSPWPEEMNRRLTSRLATYHFAPTVLAKENLLKENIPSDNIHVTGNTVIDALQSVLIVLSQDVERNISLRQEILTLGYDSNRLNKNRRLILITGHRRENFGGGFEQICHAIKELSIKYPDVDFVYPVHPNPHVKTPIESILGSDLPNIFLVNPLTYLQFTYLMSRSYLILTDSGGIQEEAPSLGKPVLVMRDTTERPEAVEAGTVKLVGADQRAIKHWVSLLLEDDVVYDKMAKSQNPYGDGCASERIVDFIMKRI